MTQRARLLILAIGAAAGLLGLPAAADETIEEIRFAPPQRIQAGDAVLGAGRLYPSPVLHDVDGDGRLDIVVGDLPGRVTFARGLEKGFEAEQPFLDRDGKALKFQNW